MRIAAFVVCLLLAGCASPYLEAGLGRINRPIDVVWVGADKFIYVPGPVGRNFGFETAETGRIIEPGLMYTDGGSVPRIAQVFRPFSPWGYAPAYIVHDWIFYGRYCELDAADIDPRYNDGRRFADVNGDPLRPRTPYAERISFHGSSRVLAEVIKTIEDNQQIGIHKVPAQFITSAVDSMFAAALWEQRHQCERLRVTPRHIATVWVRYNNAAGDPPPTWKLSKHEINEARKFVVWARRVVGTLRPVRDPSKKEQGVMGEKEERALPARTQ